MPIFENGAWKPYTGSEALLLAAGLLIIAGIFAFLGTLLHRPVGVPRAGRTVGTKYASEPSLNPIRHSEKHFAYGKPATKVKK